MKRRSHFGSGVLLGAVVALVLIAILAAPLGLAHRSAGRAETSYANAVVRVVSGIGARSVGTNPLAGDSQAVQAGRQAFTGSCAQCHGAAADGRGVFGQSTFPRSTDLTSQPSRELSDGQLFYIVKNGLGFSGMPSFASQYSDPDIWGFVTYIRDVQRNGTKAFEAANVTPEQLTFAEFRAADSPRRGAAVYFAQGCVTCHGPTGEAPEQLNFDVNSPDTVEAIREGTKGMPRYDAKLVSEAELRDLLAYMGTFPARDEEN